MMYMILYILIICITVLAYIYYFYTPNKVVENMQQQHFIPSKSFVGEKKGYVFKKDTKGLGYYQDMF